MLDLGHGCEHLLDHIHKFDLKMTFGMSGCHSCWVSVGTTPAHSKGVFGLIPNFPLPHFQGGVKLREAKLLHFEENQNQFQ